MLKLVDNDLNTVTVKQTTNIFGSSFILYVTFR